jgi:hypothetical protein
VKCWWLIFASALGATSCKGREPRPVDTEVPSPGLEAATEAGPAASASIDAAAPDAAAPSPAWLARLDELGELMCTCTTVSCTYRFSVRISKARERIPARLDDRWRQALAAIDERIAGCEDVAAADGLGRASDGGAVDAAAP